jgi:hypothetical protein
LGGIPQIETPPALEGYLRFVEFPYATIAAQTPEPRTQAPEAAVGPNKRNTLHGAASEFDIHPPSIRGQAYQSRPSEGDPWESNQSFSKGALSMQEMHVKGLKMLDRAVGSHWASAVLLVILARFVAIYPAVPSQKDAL